MRKLPTNFDWDSNKDITKLVVCSRGYMWGIYNENPILCSNGKDWMTRSGNNLKAQIGHYDITCVDYKTWSLESNEHYPKSHDNKLKNERERDIRLSYGLINT